MTLISPNAPMIHEITGNPISQKNAIAAVSMKNELYRMTHSLTCFTTPATLRLNSSILSLEAIFNGLWSSESDDLILICSDGVTERFKPLHSVTRLASRCFRTLSRVFSAATAAVTIFRYFSAFNTNQPPSMRSILRPSNSWVGAYGSGDSKDSMAFLVSLRLTLARDARFSGQANWAIP